MQINKLSGIYEITNKINGKKYIGHSINITFRWYLHIDNLFKGIHPNLKLQEDFNLYGLSAFDFSILELLDGKSNLISKEQEYLNTMDFDNNYNIYNAKNIKHPQIQEFIDFINKKWLVSSDINDDQIDKYRIYKQEDKDEIVNKAIDCQLIDLPKSHITFNKIISFMQNTLGYTIENGRFRIKKKQYRYKLIVDFDEDYMEKMLNAN